MKKDGRWLLDQLLPRDIKDRAGWSNDIYTAFTALKIPYTPAYYCAAMAVIAQESTWQSDPVVPGLPAIVWSEIDKRIHRFGIPRLVVQAAFAKSSPDGRSYNQRIDALRTERQMNALFEDMLTELPFGQQLAGDNPIRTGGPMQVGVDFATAHTKVWPYPYKIERSLRDEVFTRRGSVYFGTAHLLQYPTTYTQMIYRFADYNAGRYASRNAAMQGVLARLTHQSLKQDGYLMSYNGTLPTTAVTDSQQALFTLSGALGLSRAQIVADLKQERYAAFAQTPTYTRFLCLRRQNAGQAAAARGAAANQTGQPQDHAQAHHGMVCQARRRTLSGVSGHHAAAAVRRAAAGPAGNQRTCWVGLAALCFFDSALATRYCGYRARCGPTMPMPPG